ncbi:ribonuclease P protein component [Leucobacter sp. UCMA 4100]|uniref:ribonuclease P protein component n=1 Tax=Leucobacter sp. UCMA 4100 TaxID=2810534 RepID=UPI0022EB2E56|nr:ribonuclease P protein component [Leucobacter sp. UCMA 4100]
MPKQLHRITQGDDYRRVMRHGRRVGGPFVVAHAVLRTQDEPARFGYIVSKKVGNAVVRNRITRRLKAISDEVLRDGFTGYDVVFRASPAAAAAPFVELRNDVLREIAKLDRARQ